MVRILIFGNSGSGKSTLAKALAARHGCAHLDMDTIVWEPGRIAEARPMDAVRADLDAFLAQHASWVVEGCYGDLVEHAAHACTELIFLHPGCEACLANNRRRPWEPHKYATPEQQDAMLESLQTWVRGYYERDDAWSYAAHRRLFDAHAGDKTEYTTLPSPD
ncbi:shikimate kinase [Oleiagrimonas soli]|uniref:Shikimate kinase n=1 Tax=Oleiagrimonas soli TaxID=1543381 RepID=A0A099CWJ6_9GAMM|nr:shikimate kinase [Oleiagrimonas soli]